MLSRRVLRSICYGRGISELFKLPHDAYARRHIGATPEDAKAMLAAIGPYKSMDEFMADVVPANIVRPPLAPCKGLTETEALSNLKRVMLKNKLRKAMIGQGYFEPILPPTILRNVLENPAWYTPYTPYQAEISQGRLESLLNYQTVITEITGMDISNASLLDEATSASEAVVASLSIVKSKRSQRKKVFVDQRCYGATIEMVRTRIQGFFGDVVVGDLATLDPSTDSDLAVILVQTPDALGAIHDFSDLFSKAAKAGVLCCCGTDLMASTIAKPVGEMGADFAFGNAQRFGIPLGFGGPHPAFFATKFAHRRSMPGRLIGVSLDRKGRRALRMALQTREQHIKRQHANSNICTAQALLANMVAFYSVYHGPEGLKSIASNIHSKAKAFAAGVETVGHKVSTQTFFDTVSVKLNGMTADAFLAAADERGINVWRTSADTVSVAFDEATTDEHLGALLEVAGVANPKLDAIRSLGAAKEAIPAAMKRTTAFLKEEVFHKYHTEHELLRYITALQRKDYGLQHGMFPLGSCTMKLNSAATMLPMTWQRVNSMHPFVPASQAEGWKTLAVELSQKLKEVAGFDAVSLQPNSGAQGEYAGLRTIRAYQASIGQAHRDLVLIPANAHGTNPATAVLAGLKPLVVRCFPNGAIDVDHMAELCKEHSKNISCAMITYPSTYGVFDASIATVTDMVHQVGGQVYIDGANFNAMVGRTGPGFFGGDVCHYNLHKTFGIPHGGGGPGMGPIACREHLAPFLPGSAHGHTFSLGGNKSFGLVSQAPIGSASILTISYMLITMLGSEGMKHCTDFAVLNANYLMHQLQPDYNILFKTDKNLVAHEFIIDMSQFGKVGVKAEDVAKRLMDYGFHAPTLAFPVVNTLMVEPTESESKAELDRFVNAMRTIRKEIKLVEDGVLPKDNNPLHNAPHCTDDIVVGEWNHPYSRETAAYPVGSESALGRPKFWPQVSRINNEYGDLNLFCSCGPVPEPKK